MPGNKPTKTEIAIVMMGLFPQSIRGSALEDRAFREQLGLSVDAVIRLDKSGQQFDRSKLFAAIRQLYSDSSKEAEITSNDKFVWKLRLSADGESIFLFREGSEIALPNFVCLSSDSAKRLSWFDREAHKFELTD